MKRLLFLALAAFVVVSCSRIEESDLTPSTIPSTATSTAGPPPDTGRDVYQTQQPVQSCEYAGGLSGI